MGDWVYYSTSMTPEQISSRIEPAKEIKIAKSLDDYLQRTLKDRKAEIAKYLLGNKHRFFNSILVGVYDGLPDWIEFSIHDKMKELGATNENVNDNIGLLSFNGNERMFAIDGQHRTFGIIEALQKVKNEGLKSFINDEIPVIFLAHIDNVLGRKRTRRLFSDINKKAKAVPTKDTVIIDEEDIAAIVTRKIYATYPYFGMGELIDIDSDTRNLDKDNIKHFTNITNLYTVVKKLKPLYQRNKELKEYEDENVEKLHEAVVEFLDYILMNITEYNDFFIKKSNLLSYYRIDNKFILFRPIGFSLIAKIYAYFHKSRKLGILASNIDKLDFTMPSSFLNRILWNNGIIESNGKNQTLAFNLSLYLLGEKPPRKTTEQFLKDYRQILKSDSVVLPKRLNE